MSTLKKLLYSLAAALGAVLVSLYAAGGQPAEYRVFLPTNQPAEKIFPYLTDPTKIRLWIDGLVESKPLTDGPVRPGSRSQEIVIVEGQRTVMDSQVIELIPNQFLSVRITSPDMEAVSQFRIKSEGLEHIHQVKCKGWLRLASVFLRAPIEKKLNADFDRLKALLEK